MVVHKFQTDRKFLEEDLFMLKGFACQAAIAIENASLYTQVKDTLEEMAELSRQMKMNNEILQQRNRIHHQLLQISLHNQGIKPIIAFLNEKINKPVMFYDYLESKCHLLNSQARQVVSLDELDMLILSKPRHSQVYLKICDSGDDCFLYLHPIWLGSVFLGFVMAETSTGHLPEFDTITIEQSSSILALELVKRQTLTEIAYKKTHEFFHELLQNKDPELLKKKGKEFSLSAFSLAMVGLFEMQAIGDQPKMDADLQRFIFRLKKALQGGEMILFGFHQQVTLLVTLQHPDQAQNLFGAIQSVVTQWEKEGNDAVTGGFGSVVEGIANLSKSYEEAKRTHSYLAKTNRKRLLRYEDLGVNRLFVNHSQQEIETFVEEIFAPLRANGKNSSLEETLLVYMAANRSVHESTKKLHIHFNTLYQRLKKIEELLNVNFQNREDVLKLQLACFLRETQ
jgi:sugar diacid utilization regulator